MRARPVLRVRVDEVLNVDRRGAHRGQVLS
jgi:hypothetical protein